MMQHAFALGMATLLLLSSFAEAKERVAFIDVKGPIDPATAGYIRRGIKEATQEKAECIVLQLDTPGGLLDSTKEIIQDFYQSEIPVVVYVSPTGANATSAGCFITLASDIAAMAPNTSIGAAHPVSIGGGDSKEPADDAMKQKVENFTISYMETIAQKRGRNVEWAKSAVRESANITAETALATQVIDIIAVDLPDLLRQLDGRTVRQKVLKTHDATILEIDMSPSERLLHLLWRPELLTILMLVAVYGIIAEITHPGAVIPGVVGVVAFVMALYMSAALPVNAAGLLLMALAVALFIAEAFTPTFGLLLGGGTIAFFFGLLLLFNGNDASFTISYTFIITSTLLTSAFFTFIVVAGLRAQFLPPQTGRETISGRIASTTTDITPEGGKVFLDGSYWNAVSESPIPRDSTVRITGIHGLTLEVRPHPSTTNKPPSESP